MARGAFAVLAVALATGVAAASAGVERASRTIVVTTARATGPGSLRDVIENQAKPGDTITFRTGQRTIRLIPGLEIPKRLAGLTLQGPARVSGILEVQANRVAIREIVFGFGFAGGASVTLDRVVGARLTGNTFEGGGLVLFRTVKAVVEKNKCDSCRIKLAQTTRSRVVGNALVGGLRGSAMIWDELSTLLEIEGNRIQGGQILLEASVSATVSANRLIRGSRTPNRGIEILRRVRTGAVATLPPGGQRVVLDNNVVLGSAGDGIVFRSDAQGAVAGGLIRDSGKAGLWVEEGAIVRISRVAMGRNGGPGIDIERRGVTPNDEAKLGNDDLDWPEQLVWEPPTRKITGRTCSSCLVEGFEVEPGERKGNLRNGEGFEFRESVRADAEGKFVWPKDPITCEEAEEITFTATNDSGAPFTSEFSPSPTCAPALFAFSFKGPITTDFDGPNHPGGRRHVTHLVLDGDPCGTDPTKAVWKVRTEVPGIGSFEPRPDLAKANPAPIHTFRFLLDDVQTGLVVLKLLVTPTTASVVAEQSGDIVNLTISPAGGVPIAKTPVSSCPGPS